MGSWTNGASSTRRAAVGVALTLGIGACGATRELVPGGKSKSANGSADAALSGGIQTFDFTASYTPRPIDFIIIRDGATRQDPFNTHINDMSLVLAARLWNAGNVHVGVFDQFFDPTQTPTVPPGPTTATPIADKKVTTSILDATAMAALDFQDALSARVQTAGSRGGTYLPASVLMSLIAESQLSNGGRVNNLFRPEAFWAVLFMGDTLNPADPYDVSDVLTALNPHSGNFVISALTVDPTGCTVVGTTPPEVINKNKAPQRNLEIKMQQATSGLFASICTNPTYALFADDLVTKGTGTDFFPVTLPTAVQASTISISAGTTAVPGFRYIPGSTTLEVSTLITPGTAFQVRAQPDENATAPITSTAANVDNVPPAQPTPTPLPALTLDAQH